MSIHSKDNVYTMYVTKQFINLFLVFQKIEFKGTLTDTNRFLFVILVRIEEIIIELFNHLFVLIRVIVL